MNQPFNPQRQLARQIALDAQRRRRAGEPLTDVAVLAQYADIADVLAEELQRVAMEQRVALVQRAANAAFGDSNPALPPQPPRVGASLSSPTASAPSSPPLAAAQLQATLAVDQYDIDAVSLPSSASEEFEPDADGGEDIRMTILESSPPGDVRDTQTLPAASERAPSSSEAASSATLGEASGAAFGDTVALPNAPPSTAQPLAAPAGVVGFRPTRRPTTPLLRVLDDSQTSAEQIRIRKLSFVIGRVHGDLVIAHDPAIDPAHAEICYEASKQRWQLRDLHSRTGSFVRVQRMRLRPEDTVMLGRQRFRFLGGSSQNDPCLIRVDENGRALGYEPLWLTLPGFSIGSGPSCGLRIDDDLLNAQHAVARFDEELKRWLIEDAGSFNGLWAAIRRVHLVGDSIFQLGEQRFVFSLI